MEWLSYVFLASVGFGYYQAGKTAQQPPLYPWHRIGSSAYVWVVNPATDSLRVTVRAPAVDDAVRVLGVVPPQDGALFRLPYADTNVLLTIGSRDVVLKVRGPGGYVP
jgi:hypothetical protein